MKIEKRITAQDSENLSRYFADVRKYQSLSKEEERELIILIRTKDDKKALEKLINANLKFVISVAKVYQGQGVPILDLISEGNAGMIEAAKRFDVNQDLKFFSYAVWWIRLKMFTNMDFNSRVIQLPANRELLVQKVKRTIQKIEQTIGRHPTLDELCEHPDLEDCKEKEIKEAILYSGRTKSINEKINLHDSDDETTMEEMIEGDDSLSIDAIDKVESVLKDLNRYLYHLTQSEYDVMVLSLGLNGERIVRNSDIAKALKVKEKDIIKIKHRALKRLKRLKNINSLQDYLN